MTKMSTSLLAKLVLLLCVSTTAQMANAAVGVQAQVDAGSGSSASVSVPIPLPPGTAGLTPKVAISYSSNGALGHMARGWSISGISSVSRCGLTLPYDRVNRGVQYDNKDGYCLDGSRLLAVQAQPGLPTTPYYREFRTQQENMSRILGRFDGNGLALGFRVWTNQGTISDFGNFDPNIPNNNSVAVSPSTGWGGVSVPTIALQWSVHKHRDSLGNEIEFIYEPQNTAQGEGLRIQKIRYGKNSTANIDHHSSVDFEYALRSDVSTEWAVSGFFKTGGISRNLKRLTAVRVFTKTRQGPDDTTEPITETKVAVYKPVYQRLVYSGQTWDWVVRAIQRCRATPVLADESICTDIQPVALNYDVVPFTFAQSFTTVNPLQNLKIKQAHWVDLNGDGLTDLCTAEGNTVKCQLNTKTSYGSQNVELDAKPNYSVGFQGSMTSITVEPQLIDTHSSRKFSFVDVNGDGRLDVCITDFSQNIQYGGGGDNGPYSSGVTFRVLCHPSTTSATTVSFGPAFTLASDSYSVDKWPGDMIPELSHGLFTDLNADGLSDICYSAGPTRGSFCKIRNSRSGEYQTITAPAAGLTSGQSFIDLNRDGLTDYCGAIGSNVHCAHLQDNGQMNNAYSFASMQNVTPEAAAWPLSRIYNSSESFQVGGNWIDLNGDGYLDACLAHDNGSLVCYAGNGVDWRSSQRSAVFSTSNVPGFDLGWLETRQFIDIDGDGRVDFCRIRRILNPDRYFLGCHLNKADASNAVGVRFTPEVLISELATTPVTQNNSWLPMSGGLPFLGDVKTTAWVDVDGDGQPDFCRQRASFHTFVDCFHFRSNFGELVSVDSVGNQTLFHYSAMASSMRYTPMFSPVSLAAPSAMVGTLTPTYIPGVPLPSITSSATPPLTYPFLATTQNNRFVSAVDRTIVTNGSKPALTQRTTYGFEGFIVNVLDSRSSGYFKTKVFRTINGGVLKSETTNAIAFPFAGSPLKTESFFGATRISLTESNYAAEYSRCGPAGFGTSVPSGVHAWPLIVYSNLADEKSWDSSAGNPFVKGTRRELGFINPTYGRFDYCGNPRSVTTTNFETASTLSGFKTTAINSYFPANFGSGIDVNAPWVTGRIQKIVTTLERPAVAAVVPGAVAAMPSPGVDLNPPPPPTGSNQPLPWLPAVLSLILN